MTDPLFFSNPNGPYRAPSAGARVRIVLPEGKHAHGYVESFGGEKAVVVFDDGSRANVHRTNLRVENPSAPSGVVFDRSTGAGTYYRFRGFDGYVFVTPDGVAQMLTREGARYGAAVRGRSEHDALVRLKRRFDRSERQARAALARAERRGTW